MERKTFCLMVDCSRNAVLNLNALKRLVELISKCGYNALMLYTEDTYEVEGEPYFGHLRGRYSKEEIKEIVNYAKTFDVEVIPCIQVLAHLNQVFKWPKYLTVHDYKDVLLVGEEKTYELIEKMIKSIKGCFKSKRIHLGLDEAEALGLGNSFKRDGYINKKELFMKHLQRVLQICDKYELSPLMWSDMFFKIIKEEQDWYKNSGDISDENLKNVPQNVTPVYWDYYHVDVTLYKNLIDKHFVINKNTWFAGGVWTWVGFAPLNKVALAVTQPAMQACREKGINNVIITAWGDDGAECSIFSALPSIFAAKKMYDGVDDLEQIKDEFKHTIGLDFDDFMLLDSINDTTKAAEAPLKNPSKYLLYNDPLMGLLDTKVCLEDDQYFGKLSQTLNELSKRLGEFGYIAKHLSKLASVLEMKNSLGVRIRKGYQSGDKKALSALSKEIDALLPRIDEFILAFRESWYKERKTFGFDVQEIRLGGIKERIKEAKNRIEEYLSGKITSIEELKQPVLPYNFEDKSDIPGCFNDYIAIASPNKI